MARRPSAQENIETGFAVSAGMASSLSGAGDSPARAASSYLNERAQLSGFQQISSFYSMLFGLPIVYGLLTWGVIAINNFVINVLWIILSAMIGLGAAIGLTYALFTYTAMRLKCRAWPVDDPNPTYGGAIFGNILVDTILVTPFRLALVLVCLPFWMIGSVFEVIRVIGGNLAGKPHISYRGDAGMYYDRVRKHYAKVYHESGVQAANDYLRMAFSGMLTPICQEIPPHEWGSDKQRNAWLATLIQRHGPINQYVTGPAGSPRATYAAQHGGVPNSTGGYTYDYTAEGRARRPAKPVSKKYDAL